MILIYTTHNSKDEAQKITSLLFEQKLIACVNYFSMESAYVWEGEEQSEEETVALYKTAKENWEEVRTLIEANHPYDKPCIIKLEAEANEAFAKWVLNESRGK